MKFSSNIISLVFIFTACDTCIIKKGELARYDLTQLEINFIPYDEGDSLLMQTGFNDTVLFIVSDFVREYDQICDEACCDYHLEDRLNFELINTKRNQNISIHLRKVKSPAYPEEGIPYYTINIFDYQRYDYKFTLNHLLPTTDPRHVWAAPVIHEKYNVLGKPYHNVYALSSYIPHPDASDTGMDTLYYTHNEGIIEISFRNKNSYPKDFKLLP